MDEPKVNILLVDDDAGNLLALEAALASLDQNLVTARSGKEALKSLLKHEFAVILLDVRMPVMDGFETATLIRQGKKTRHTPIIFLTGASNSETHVSRGYSLGAVDYLFKPVMPDIVSAKVAVFVDLFIKEREREREQEHARQREQLERELRALKTLSHSSQMTVTAATFGLKSLREGSPERFYDMVRHYGDLMDLALERRALKGDYDIPHKLQDLADRLGSLHAGPRDVVEVHRTALKKKLKGENPKKVQAYIDEGHLVILEVMGRLVSHYRAYARSDKSGTLSDSQRPNSTEVRPHE